LVRAADRAARRLNVNRSALIRDALREHLKRLRTREKERLDREGYQSFPDDEFAVWDRVASWPED
jgi:metal-responsive CopG/Arc/MetJ family transcriptional regulator